VYVCVCSGVCVWVRARFCFFSAFICCLTYNSMYSWVNAQGSRQMKSCKNQITHICTQTQIRHTHMRAHTHARTLTHAHTHTSIFKSPLTYNLPAQGFLPTLLEDAPDMAVKFAVYETARTLYCRMHNDRQVRCTCVSMQQ